MKVKNKIFIIIIFIELFFNYTMGQDNKINDLIKYYKKVNSIKYKFKFSKTSYHNNDTLILEGNVIRKNIIIDSNYFTFYNIRLKNGQKFVKNQNEKIKLDSGSINIISYSDSLAHLSIYESKCLNDFFFISIISYWDSTSTNYFKYIKDTILNKAICMKLSLYYKIDFINGYFKNDFYLDKYNKKILYSEAIANWGNVYDHEKMEFYDVEFLDTISNDSFTRKVFGDKYGIPISMDSILKNDLSIVKNDFLKIGDTIRTISGKLSINNFQKDTIKFVNQIYIIDIWYMACPPCLRSIPHLINIQNKYRAKGVKIIGINNIDYNKDINVLKNFIIKKLINYDILLSDNNEFKQFKTSLAPVLIIANKKGIVKYIKNGYTDHLEDLIEAQINKILNE